MIPSRASFYLNIFSPARMGTFSQFSRGGRGQEYALLYAQSGYYARKPVKAFYAGSLAGQRAGI